MSLGYQTRVIARVTFSHYIYRGCHNKCHAIKFKIQ